MNEKSEKKAGSRAATTRPDSRRGMSKGQIRKVRRDRSRARKNRRRNLIMFGGLLIAFVFIAGLVVSPGLISRDTMDGEGKGVNEGGHIALDPDDGREHIDPEGYAPNKYSVSPATSGPHWYKDITPAGVPAPARWGVYDKILPDEVLIHNLEHGGIGLHYDCPDGCEELINSLRDIVPRNPSFYIVSPYPSLEKRVAITAWRHHLYLDEFDRDQIIKFIEEYIDHAPESVPSDPW